MPFIALTRAVSPRITECELTYLRREPIDVTRAAEQHRAYRAALVDLGCELRCVERAPDQPDAVFVEDTAIVLDEMAILARPGAPSRRAEVPAVAAALEPLRPLRQIRAPATVDGGDVLVAGSTVFVGMSGRTNAAGHAALRDLVEPHGYALRVVPVDGCLHLKSAVTEVAHRTLLVNPACVDRRAFRGYELLEVDAAEPAAANGLRIGDRLLLAAGFPRTRARLDHLGLDAITVDISELAKAEGGVTCCSIIVPS